MVSKQEDTELVARYIATRDPKHREAVMLRFVPLVHFVLGRLGLSQSIGQDYEDMVSQGLLGLIDAVDRFDPDFGTQFSTYATLRIRGNVLDHLRSLDWLPRSARQRARAVQEAITSLSVTLKRPPTDQELAEHLNLDLPKLRKALVDAGRVFISLDNVIDTGGDGDATLHEMLADENQVDPSDAVVEKDMQEHLVTALKSLSEREQLILSLYYYEELTMKEIGVVLGVSESRVCQLHARAIMNLRALLEMDDTSRTLKGNRAAQRKAQIADMAATSLATHETGL